MLPNEKFALKCRERYEEDGLVVDQSNGEFAHCPLPKGLGETGYYLLHDDHQWQGLLQSRDVGRRCFWTPNTKKWLLNTSFVEEFFDLWDIFDEFVSGVHSSHYGKPLSEEHKRKLSEARKRRPPASKETREKMSEARKGEKHPMFGKTGKLTSMFGKHHTEETRKKQSEANKGHTVSEETRRKIGEANKKRNQEKRLHPF